ncbi:MAG TPA: hypothetical protein VHA11_06735 [Bryobacteraceae bacterium]|nr:hypothetical protein [Bryobacteraceae bacterium]
MKLRFTGVGADKKKVAALAGLLLVLGYVFYSNVLAPDDDIPAPRPRAATRSADEVTGAPAPEVRARPPLRPGAEAQATRPQFKMSPRDQRPDPTTIDPTLRLDLLAKVQAVTLEGGARNLFQFSEAPLPKTPEPKIVPRMPGQAAQAAAAVNAPPVEPPKPQPPPIPLRFYGYTSQARQTERRAFFLDGDDIVVAAEGQTIKNRYKVVRISINSVVVEDTQFQHQQTLPLEEMAG